MKCPDCGVELGKAAVLGNDDSFRCPDCGGFWVQGWVVNKVAEEGIKADYKPLKKSRMEGTTRNCPTDNVVLMKPEGGEQFPPEVGVYKCKDCHWWWVAGDDMFTLDEAFKARRSYFQMWKQKQNWATWALPVVAVLVLAIGLAGVVQVTRMGTQWGLRAGSTVRNYTAIYSGSGVAIVSFQTNEKITSIEFMKVGMPGWDAMGVEELGGGKYQVRLEGLEEGQEYLIRVLGKEYKFTAK